MARMSTIQDIKLMDIEKRRTPSKHYAFIIEVSWSDDSVLNIGRAYSEFFDFQMTLLDRFPSEAGQNDPTKRIIPFLPGKSLFRRSNTREYALKRMGPISEYCTGISKMPRYIIDNSIVEDFFRQNPSDQARRHKSSPQDDITRNTNKANEITGPLVLDKYVAIADYNKENKKELSLKSGQVLEVVEKSENGWWLAANEEGMNGWVPATYLETLYGEASSQTENNRVKPGEGEMFEADTDFSASSADEMTFKIGDVLEVLEKSLEGWWYAKIGNNEGWVPATYLQKSSLPTPKASNQQADHDQTRTDLHDTGLHHQPLHRGPLWGRPGSIEGTKKPPPKRSTVRRTLTKAAVARVQVDFRMKYLKEQENAITEENEDEDVELNETYLTIDEFDSTIPDGLSFLKCETVHVIRKSNAGWWYGRIGNKRGWVPESYLSLKSPSPTLVVPTSPPPPKPSAAVATTPGGMLRNSEASTKPSSNESNQRFMPSPKPQKPARPPAPKTPPKTGGKNNVATSQPSPKITLPNRAISPKLPVPSQGKKQPFGSPTRNRISTETDMTDYEWYRDISRQQAEEALLCEGQEGYFIIRPSVRGEKKGKPYSLTLYHQRTNWNFHIRLRADKKYAVGIYKETEACFRTLPELVDHYKQTPLVLGDEERKVLLSGSPQELYAAC